MAVATQVQWNARTAAHLLRRAGFGGTPEEAARLEALGMEGAVDHLLQPSEGGLDAPATDPAEREKERRLRQARKNGKDEEFRRFKRQQMEAFRDIQYWWLRRMRDPRQAVSEKLTLFWHGHFATSQTKVRCNHAMLLQNQTLRRLGSGPFRDLCEAMVCDPAMLVWLDGRQNQAKAPNENFSREVMELFTLGEGNYTEDDIREAARAFTGWVVHRDNGQADFVPRRYDSGEKVIFGKRGRFDAAGTIDLLCSLPRCAEFLAGKLWEFYAGRAPSPELAPALASRYGEEKLHTGKFLRFAFTHPEFYSDRVRSSQVKSPVQWLVQASSELGRQLLPPGVALPLVSDLGQRLFQPPSVKGWDGGAAWINSATLIRRSNTARLFVSVAPPLPEIGESSLDALAWRNVAPPEARVSADALQKRLEAVFLAAAPSTTTRHHLGSVLEKKAFPCTDETVREASMVLLAAPEYNLC
ncbi:MAG: DUF1800 domain-containing protein [Chthoniobacterales bacterium]|nr:DUF1800 domain-containing protein [Chthoniobacterales bacterium]